MFSLVYVKTAVSNVCLVIYICTHAWRKSLREGGRCNTSVFSAPAQGSRDDILHWLDINFMEYRIKFYVLLFYVSTTETIVVDCGHF